MNDMFQLFCEWVITIAVIIAGCWCWRQWRRSRFYRRSQTYQLKRAFHRRGWQDE